MLFQTPEDSIFHRLAWSLYVIYYLHSIFTLIDHLYDKVLLSDLLNLSLAFSFVKS